MGFSTSKVIKRIILRQNGLKTDPFKPKNMLFEAQLNSINEKKRVFNIFKSCMLTRGLGELF